MEFVATLLVGLLIGYMIGYQNGYNTLLRQLKAYAKAKRTRTEDLYPKNENN